MLTQWTCSACARTAAQALLLLLSGCTNWQSQPPERVIVVDSVPIGPAREAPAQPSPPRPALEPFVAVVLSSDAPAFAEVADALDKALRQGWVRYELNSHNRAALLSNVRTGGHSAAVAIGQQALDLLSETGLPITYCQTLDNATLQSGRRSVAPMPTFGAQIDAWRVHQPGLARIGMITGPGYDDMAEALAAAAAERSLEVSHGIAHSDREMLHRFQRMVPDIQGFILYPDARIQSPRTLRELMTYADKHGVWVVTYNRAIFDLGATLLVSTDPMEIADQVAAALKAPDGVRLPLHRVRVERRLDPRALADAAP